MADISTDTIYYFHAQGVEGEISVAAAQINANNGGVCWVFQAEEAAVITRISLRISAVVTAASSSLSVGLQSLTTGAPSGSWLDDTGTGTPKVSTTNFASEVGTTTGVKTYTLPQSVTLTAGQMFAVVVRNPTAGWTGDLSYNYTHFIKAGVGVPYHIRRTSGVWGTRGSLYPSYVFYGSATKWYGASGLSTAESSATAPSGTNEFGWAITIPSGHPDLRLHCVYQKLVTFAAGGTFNVVVRDTAGTALQTSSFDQDFTSPSGYYPCILSSDLWLTAGNKYYIMFQAGTGVCPNPRIMSGFGTAGLLSDVSNGIVCNTVTYNGTTFTETTTTRPVGSLIFNAIKYTQTSGTTNYIIPAGFNVIG